MLDEVNMKSNQREHQNFQVKRLKKKRYLPLQRIPVLCVVGLGEKKGNENVGEVSGGRKAGLLCFVILFPCPTPSKRIDF